MGRMLIERERLLGDLLPWADPNFGLGEWWVRSYPYEQEAAPGARLAIDLHFTNHGPKDAAALAEPVLPTGRVWDHDQSAHETRVPARTDGRVDGWCARPDGTARLWIDILKCARPGTYVVPFRVTWDGRYLGQFRHAIVPLRP